VQQCAHELLDQIGQRLTNSPNMRRAEAWATAEMQALGLDNVHKQGFEFGRGWEMMSSDVRMVAPRALELSAIPVAWTPGTNGTIEAEIIVAPISEVAHFEAYRGRLAGAHFDSWAAGDGAVDNGAGSITVLEAARILKQMGVRPRRTIRFALWSGEEQGLLGSLAYVRQHLVSRAGEDAVPADSLADEWRNLYPITPKPGYSQLKAYFNMDNGSGKFRGIHAEGNVAAEPLLRKWMAPFTDMGASTVVAGKTGGTDHVYLQAIGLPGYQFIQDPLDYFARLHHTNIDTFDHLRTDDLRQASVVMAGTLLAAANDKDTIAPMPLPQKPLDTDPFEYDYPED